MMAEKTSDFRKTKYYIHANKSISFLSLIRIVLFCFLIYSFLIEMSATNCRIECWQWFYQFSPIQFIGRSLHTIQIKRNAKFHSKKKKTTTTTKIGISNLCCCVTWSLWICSFVHSSVILLLIWLLILIQCEYVSHCCSNFSDFPFFHVIIPFVVYLLNQGNARR